MKGQVFTRWTVVGGGDRHWNGYPRVLCRCECGVERMVGVYHLRAGMSRGCGGVRIPGLIATHGLARTPEYAAWKQTVAKCSSPGHYQWTTFGGRGIRIHDEWMNFEAFMADVGPRPSSEHRLGRINLDGHFEPGNVAWTTERPRARPALDRRRVVGDVAAARTFTWRGRVRHSVPGG